ncbi:hypothetical protein QUV93_01570 [Phascolarctobacterium faecium]|nr:hypothetical protein [Phascolarctobacterium faecium]MDM8108557.1 hypothetical protein [Phascolarctobacterium faecium]
MANWNGLQLTNKGIALQAKVQAGTQLHITKLKLGSGVVPSGTDVKTLTDLIAPEQNLGIGGKEAVDDYCKISSTISNTGLDAGYYVRELGVFAQDPDDGEILYMYTTDGAPDYLPAGGGSTVISQEFSVMIAVEDTDNIVVDIDPAALATMGYVQLQIQEHNTDTTAHADFTGATAKAAGKRGMVPAPAAGDQNKALFGDKSYKSVVQSINGITPDAGGGITLVTGINMLARNQAYQYGDIAYSPNLPSWAYLFCVQAGTTAASEPSFSSVSAMGQYITDGTVKWIVDDVRFGLPVGVPFHDKKLRPGCVKINGATVQRSDYIRIFHDADEDDAFYDKDDRYSFTGTTTVSGTTITGISAEDIEKLQTAKEVCGDGILITGTGIPEDCMIDEISTDSVTITVAATAAGSNVKISYGNIHNYPYLYGWGDGETTFVLPDYRARVIQGGDTRSVKAAGIPNITGTHYCDVNGLSYPSTGAFEFISKNYPNQADGQNSNSGVISFDASRCTKVYSNIETVQPPAFSLIPQVKF